MLDAVLVLVIGAIGIADATSPKSAAPPSTTSPAIADLNFTSCSSCIRRICKQRENGVVSDKMSSRANLILMNECSDRRAAVQQIAISGTLWSAIERAWEHLLPSLV
jgi:hypothetical protein